MILDVSAAAGQEVQGEWEPEYRGIWNRLLAPLALAWCVGVCNYGPRLGLVTMVAGGGVRAFSAQRVQSRLPAPGAEDRDEELSSPPAPRPPPGKVLLTCCRRAPARP